MTWHRPAAMTLLLAVALVLTSVTACSDNQNGLAEVDNQKALADVCALVDLKDGPIALEGYDEGRDYYREIRDAARRVDTPDLEAIAERYGRVFDAWNRFDQEDRQDLLTDPEFMEATMSLNPSELVGICIDHGLIDERFRDGLP